MRTQSLEKANMVPNCLTGAWRRKTWQLQSYQFNFSPPSFSGGLIKPQESNEMDNVPRQNQNPSCTDNRMFSNHLWRLNQAQEWVTWSQQEQVQGSGQALSANQTQDRKSTNWHQRDGRRATTNITPLPNTSSFRKSHPHTEMQKWKTTWERPAEVLLLCTQC